MNAFSETLIPAFSIRLLTPDMASAAADIRAHGITTMAQSTYTAHETETWLALDSTAKLADYLASPLVTAFGAFRGDVLYGFAVLKGNEICKLFCIPRHGAGSLLLAQAEACCAEKGFPEVITSASRNAVPFYIRYGYTRMGYHYNDYTDKLPGMAGTIFPTVWMQKYVMDSFQRDGILYTRKAGSIQAYDMCASYR
jgi:GNAT superfamily N-acetyltransferase